MKLFLSFRNLAFVKKVITSAVQEARAGYLASDEAIKIIKDVYSSQHFYDELLREIKSSSIQTIQSFSKNSSQEQRPSNDSTPKK